MEKNVKIPDKSDPVLQFYKYNKLKDKNLVKKITNCKTFYRF
jgi:hypothetical protein